MVRKFTAGRQNEQLLNDDLFKIYKLLMHIGDMPIDNVIGPAPSEVYKDIENNALWIDKTEDEENAELKFYQNGKWNLFFKNRFKIFQDILSPEEPLDPLPGQLWINSGILHYYEKGMFVPIKAIQSTTLDINMQGFEDFIFIDKLVQNGYKIIDNFSEQMMNSEIQISVWAPNTNYKVDNIVIYNGYIYKCIQNNNSNTIDISDINYWEKIIYLVQFLMPSVEHGRFFVNGNFVHEKTKDGENGYIKENKTCITYPLEKLENKISSAVHVNPKRLKRINKKLIAINKNNPRLNIDLKNLELYALQSGLGKLLIKTDNIFTDYSIENGMVKLSPHIVENYDMIYAINYEFLKDGIKGAGKLETNKIILSEENSIYVGNIGSDFCVFAQGLYYEQSDKTYSYDKNTGYIKILEPLQDKTKNITKQYDFSVVKFPIVEQVKVINQPIIEDKGLQITLNKVFFAQDIIVFIDGVVTTNIIPHETDPTILYLPDITQDMIDNNPDIYCAVVGTVDHSESFEMYRGSILSKFSNTLNKAIIPITSIEEDAIPGEVLYLKDSEEPILFVDGIYVFQKEIERGNGYLSIYGLKEGQDIKLLADTTNEHYLEGLNSDRIVFEDTISYATIPVKYNDNTLVYVNNYILFDSGYIYTSRVPTDPGQDGEIKIQITSSNKNYFKYNNSLKQWIIIEDQLEIELIESNIQGYIGTKKSISFLQNLENSACTYYAYTYANAIENPLLMDYIYPDGIAGTPSDPFKIHPRHNYIPGRNELTVYLNGVMQVLDGPIDSGFIKEGNIGETNTIYFSIDKEGSPEPLLSQDGYYVYYLTKDNKTTAISSKTKLSNEEIQQYTNNNYIVELISSPRRHCLFYVIEQTETDEVKSCERKVLTYKDSFAAKGANVSNCYDTGDFIITRGNIRVFINGIRQPFGGYQTPQSKLDTPNKFLNAYKVLDSNTLKLESPLIGSLSQSLNPLYPEFEIGKIIDKDGNEIEKYYEVIDSIVIEVRNDLRLREITIPLYNNKGEFSVNDGLPKDLFETKDKLMIYINGLAYGKEYVIEEDYMSGFKTLRLTSDYLKYISNNNNNVITFEWR